MNAQLCVEKEDKLSRFIEDEVYFSNLNYLTIRKTMANLIIGEALEPWAIQTVPCKEKTQMFWACFGFGKRTDLVIMDGNPKSPQSRVTAHCYIQVLEEYLPTILEHDSVFMHDNASIHSAHIVRDWFIEQGIFLMRWPPYSPDLNPIENLWAILKAEIIRAHPELVLMGDNQAAMDFLIECAKEAWEVRGEQLLNKLAEGMQKRVDAVLKAKGWYIGY